MKNPTLAQQLFNQGFAFNNRAEMMEAIVEERQRETRENRFTRSLTSSHMQLLVVHPEGGRIEEHRFGDAIDIGSKYGPTQTELVAIVQQLIDCYGYDNLPNFDIVLDGELNTWETAQDKFDGQSAEPTGAFFEVVLVSYRKPNFRMEHDHDGTTIVEEGLFNFTVTQQVPAPMGSLTTGFTSLAKAKKYIDSMKKVKVVTK